MAFTGHENHSITLPVATLLTKSYRDENDLAGNPSLVRAVFFGKDALLGVLNQPECVGIRCYFALDDAKSLTLVIVGATTDQDDLLRGQAKILEIGLPSPPFCPAADSPL